LPPEDGGASFAALRARSLALKPTMFELGPAGGEHELGPGAGDGF